MSSPLESIPCVFSFSVWFFSQVRTQQSCSGVHQKSRSEWGDLWPLQTADQFRRESNSTRIERVVYFGFRAVFCLDLGENRATRQSCHTFRFSELVIFSSASVFSMLESFFFLHPFFSHLSVMLFQITQCRSINFSQTEVYFSEVWSILSSLQVNPTQMHYNKRDKEGSGCRGRKLRDCWSKMAWDTVSKGKLFSRSTAFPILSLETIITSSNTTGTVIALYFYIRFLLSPASLRTSVCSIHANVFSEHKNKRQRGRK